MYKNIFANIKKGSDLSIYENHFTSVTNQNYKEFLTKMYINEDKTKRDVSDLLGTSQGVIITHTKKYNLKKEYIMDTSNVMHKTPSSIEKETGRKFIDIYNELANQGLSLTEICMKLSIKNISTVSTYLYNHKQREEKNNKPSESKLIIQGLKGKNKDTVEHLFYNELGIEFKDFLEQKYMKEHLTLDQIAELVGISKYTLSDRMKEYGFHKSKSQVRREAMKRGTINYDKILSKGRKTRSKSNSLSHKQDLLITLLKHNLEALHNGSMEIIIGYNEYCILGSLEVDIPIIIIQDNQIYKIAIEYDGDVWHNERESDIDKASLLKEKNWHLIRIEETNIESGRLGIVEDKAKLVVNEIVEYIK